MSDSRCRGWYEEDPILEEYHDHEWCKENHNDQFQFEMLCLEGASVGLSWKTIMHKRESYRAAFHDFDIEACAAMTDQELEALLSDSGLIRNRNKIFSVRKNAQIVKKIQEEFGSFDAYIWSFTDGRQLDGGWKAPEEVPTVSDVSRKMSADMKKRGIGFVGPVITYSFLQAVGIVNDHLADCEYRK
ncbi:MAG: DNA-3-methyladenine glycosylase I [Lachnospiraceae bacterium]|nr:DNA-3-methyladenine glycosylase I [Lachnospiraceae bacterium]